MLKLNRDIVRAYLWRKIIRLGFSPAKSKDQKAWIYLFLKSLKDFWEIEGHSHAPTQIDGIQFVIQNPGQPNLKIRFSPAGIYDYGATVVFVQNTRREMVLWVQHSDSRYFTFPEQAFLTKKGPESIAVREMRDGDMESVIDSLICHPQPHQHIEPPIGNEYIRIGGGIDNSFLFLFHLRYQLCSITEKREAEKRRLVALFHQVVKNDNIVPPNDLMQQP